MIYWELFRSFFLIGTVSFGGGYAMIPMIEMEVSRNGWMTTKEFTDVIAIAGMSPGPIATNSAVFVGFQTAGVLGAIVSALGMILPSFLLILLVASLFYRSKQHRLVQSAFYGLRPIITGLIFYAAIRFSITNGLIAPLSTHMFSMLCIFLLSLFLLIKLRVHPAAVIGLSGMIGIVLYY